MKLLAIIPGVLATAALLGCENPDAASLFEDSKEYRYARATQAMSYLKKYQVAANVSQVETGRYGLLQNIYENGDPSGLISDELYQAWDGHVSPQPLEGYLFSSVETDPSGAPIDQSERAGLCAYPSEPGKTGDLIVCVLADPRHFTAEALEGGGYVSHGEEWTFYSASYEDIGEPVRHWPSDDELAGKFRALKPRLRR